ncbi:MAG TPA: hypothetical protein VK436_09820 [Methanocella sp.]|nr:hypothetical protein [Methanocella sp.]
MRIVATLMLLTIITVSAGIIIESDADTIADHAIGSNHIFDRCITTDNDQVATFGGPGDLLVKTTSPLKSDDKSHFKYNMIPNRQDSLQRHPVLIENPEAHVPSYKELMNFLDSDSTVHKKYDFPNFTCADFAVELQHNAEGVGIKCGYAGLNFVGKDDGHALAVFPTTDAGMIYVDTTSGKTIITKNLCDGMKYFNNGVISDINVYW